MATEADGEGPSQEGHSQLHNRLDTPPHKIHFGTHYPITTDIGQEAGILSS